MFDLRIDYQGTEIPIGEVASGPREAAVLITNGYIPGNFLQISNQSDSFRDATLGHLVDIANENGNAQVILATLARGLAGAQDGSIQLRIFTEYFASIAYAYTYNDLAAKAIMRNKPSHVSSYIWAIMSSIRKKMPSSFYATILSSSKQESIEAWNKQAESMFNLPTEPTQTI